MILDEYGPDDLARLKIRDTDVDLRGMDQTQLARQLAELPGYKRTLIDLYNGADCLTNPYQIVAVGGVIDLTPGRGECWLICDECVVRYKREALEAMEQVITAAVAERGYHRLEANVHEGHELGLRMTPKLGFRLESIKFRYFPDGGASYHFTRFPGV